MLELAIDTGGVMAAGGECQGDKLVGAVERYVCLWGCLRVRYLAVVHTTNKMDLQGLSWVLYASSGSMTPCLQSVQRGTVPERKLPRSFPRLRMKPVVEIKVGKRNISVGVVRKKPNKSLKATLWLGRMECNSSTSVQLL